MITDTMTAAAEGWVMRGAPAFDVWLLSDGPEPHDGRGAAMSRARFVLACDLGLPWSLKRLAYALNDWLADAPVFAAVIVDASVSEGRATFDVAVWHREGRVESPRGLADGPAGA